MVSARYIYIPPLYIYLEFSSYQNMIDPCDTVFKQAENIKFTIEQQMVFFARLIGRFNVADPITPIKVDNFD